MKFFRKKAAILLVLCMILSLLSGCTKQESASKGKTREAKKTSVTNTPTPTDGPEPTGEPTGTPEVTPTPVDGKPWSTPAVNIPQYTDEQEQFDDFLDEITREMGKDSGMDLHFYFEYPEQFGMSKSNTFGEVEADPAEYAEFCNKYKSRMAGFDYEALTPGQQVNYDRLMYEFNIGIQAESLNYETYCALFSENNNVVNSVSTMLTEYAFLNEQDIKDFLETIEDSPRFFSEVLELARKEYLDKGCLLLESMLDVTVEYIDGIIVEDNNPLVEGFAANIVEAGLTEEQNAEYIRQYQDKLKQYLFPSLQSFKAEIQKWYDACDDETFGMCKLPGGKEYYEYSAQATLGTDMSCTDMFDYLKAKFDDEYSALVKLYRFHPDSFGNYPSDDYTVEDPVVILDSLKEYIKQNYPEIRETRYTVSALPEALRVDGVLAYFMPPQYDNGSRKIMRFNPDGITDCTSFFSTLAHEGYPGHLYQHEFFSHCEGYRPINALLSYTGYTEGWAVVAGEQAYYYILEDTNLADIYAIDYNLNMDLCAIADIGVNYMGWSVGDLKNFLDGYGLGDDETASYVYDAVAVDAFVYLPYTIGRYLMLDTFEQLEAKGYSDIEAKTAVLNIGPCTFEILWKHLGINSSDIY
ncbi:MAG: DUF885 domain-containing protein [Lachnospiraceae bacterium]|nr:DUF885 domain-containing protein [Lachnospiraceae bacterium]